MFTLQTPQLRRTKVHQRSEAESAPAPSHPSPATARDADYNEKEKHKSMPWPLPPHTHRHKSHTSAGVAMKSINYFHYPSTWCRRVSSDNDAAWRSAISSRLQQPGCTAAASPARLEPSTPSAANAAVATTTPPMPMTAMSSPSSPSQAPVTTAAVWPSQRRVNTSSSSSNSSCSSCCRPSSQASPGRRHMLLALLLLLCVCLVNTSAAKAGEGLLGDMQSCSNEGEEVPVSIRNSKCFKCSCQNGFVKCEGSCPPIEDCYLLDRKTSDSCCIKCKGCIYRGLPYASGSEWTDPDDACKSYKCVGGVVTETTMKCYTQCDDNMLMKPRPGECCPTCQGCKLNGQTVLEGQEVVASIDDRCLVCQCSGNQLTCAKKTCPVLQCPVSKQKLHPNECCPRCTEQREFMPLMGGKCFFNNKIFYDKIEFMPDRCTNCTCANGTSVCHRKTCPILECSPEYQEMDGCCPRCITSEVRSECTYNGISYQNNETWSVGTCRSCRCTQGNIRCSERRCNAVKCRSNEELKVLPGECCPRCIEPAGTCTVFGDPHFKTFDGKFFSFQGPCKYQLAADCRDHSFSIRLTNDGRETRRSSWAKTVTLKMRNLRVNLGQKQRVKVNGSRVALPYSGGPITSIERLKESIMLRTDIGLSIEWDGNNYLQVTVPSSFKHRLCGLCGNFNGLARDDLTSRDGYNHTEVWRFANSWKVGGPKACSRKQEKIAVEPSCRQRKSNAMCRPLRISRVFGYCDTRVNPNNYIDSCKMDVCECPYGMCHCDSFAAYARECQRLGVDLPDWRQETDCPHGVWKRDFNTTLKILRNNLHYGDLRFLQHPQKHRQSQRRRKQERQQHHNNEFLPRDFITKHVPKNLLISKSPDRTPPPLNE